MWERLFMFGMWWRIFYGFFRIIIGLATLKLIGTPLIDIVTIVMSHELSQDPHDTLYRTIKDVLGIHPVYISYFVACYFIFWGIVDVVLSTSLIKHKLWAFPASFVVMGGFIVYEIFRFMHTQSRILLAVILIDSIILRLIWREYKRLRVASSSRITQAP